MSCDTVCSFTSVHTQSVLLNVYFYIIRFTLCTFIHTYVMCLYRVATLEVLDEDKVAWIPSKVLHRYFRDSLEDESV